MDNNVEVKNDTTKPNIADPMSFVRQLREQRREKIVRINNDDFSDWNKQGSSSRDDIIFSILQKHDKSNHRPPRKRPSEEIGTSFFISSPAQSNQPRRHSVPLTAQSNLEQRPNLEHIQHYTSALNALLASQIIQPLNFFSQALVNATMSAAAAAYASHIVPSSSAAIVQPPSSSIPIVEVKEDERQRLNEASGSNTTDVSSPRSDESLKRLKELKLDEPGNRVRSGFEKDRFERMVNFGVNQMNCLVENSPVLISSMVDNKRRKSLNNRMSNGLSVVVPSSSQPLPQLQAQVMQIVCDMVANARRDIYPLSDGETMFRTLIEQCWHSLMITYMIERNLDLDLVEKETRTTELIEDRTELRSVFKRAKVLIAGDRSILQFFRQYILFNSGCPQLRKHRELCSAALAVHTKQTHQNGLARYARLARFAPSIAQMEQDVVKIVLWDSIFDGTDVVALIDHLCSI